MEVGRFPPSIFLEIRDPSNVGEARRTGIAYAVSCGFDETRSSTVGLIMTELSNNLVRHASDAHIVVQGVGTPNGDSVEILSIDCGPGMKDVAKCLMDGFSTAGTPGNGLGAVQRMSDEFDIFSVLAQGTVIVSRVLRGDRPEAPRKKTMLWGVYSRPVSGETVCGDGWRVDSTPERSRFMVSDGLGHGPEASKAAQSVAEAFEQDRFASPSQFLNAAHQKATGTRGAAVAIAQLEMSSDRLRYAGIGNISGILANREELKGLPSQNGTVGMALRKPQETEYPWPNGALLIMHSDGIQTRWSFKDYPGLQCRHPSIVAGVLARDFKRDRDDRTVLVAKLGNNDID